MTWYEANDECRAINWTLAVTDTREKIRNVSVLTQKQKQNGANLWVGLHRIEWKKIPGEFY